MDRFLTLLSLQDTHRGREMTARGLELPRAYRRAFRSTFQATIPMVSGGSRWRISASAGGMQPLALCRRSVLYQSTQCMVSHATFGRFFHGPSCLITSVLKRPMTLSASALSQESPIVPTEGPA